VTNKQYCQSCNLLVPYLICLPCIKVYVVSSAGRYVDWLWLSQGVFAIFASSKRGCICWCEILSESNGCVSILSTNLFEIFRILNRISEKYNHKSIQVSLCLLCVFFQFFSDVYNYNNKYLHNCNQSRKKLNPVYYEISLNTTNT
jgi:hypothetical protein